MKNRNRNSHRVRAHARRRDVEAPRYPTPTSPQALAVVLGWRPIGG